MKIRTIELLKFKRFTDTKVGDIPPETKLVLLAGPNGSGKSSLIDAVHFHHRQHSGLGGVFEANYHVKQIDDQVPSWDTLVKIEFHGVPPQTQTQKRKAIYVRSAYRNEPEFEIQNLTKVGLAIDTPRFGRLIDNDQSVSQNYHRLVSKGIEDLYDPSKGKLTFDNYVKGSVGELRAALIRLFPDLYLSSLANPLQQGTFRFVKGDSKDFLYKNLSGGEKSAFDLLLDIYVKREEYDDTVFFIDEPEAHIAHGLQGPLLQELYDLIPENGQLWISTHSIGMMRKARDLSYRHPGSVAFLDFDGVNFDLPVTLSPVLPDRPFWKRAMQVALDDIAGYVAPERVVLCEGGGVTEGTTFDADCYNEIFKIEYPHVVFLGAGNSDDIERDPKGVERLVKALTPSVGLHRLMDRDDRTDSEIAAMQKKGTRVLKFRTIESYLLDDEILSALCMELGKPESAKKLLREKAKAIRQSVKRGHPKDNLKTAAGDIYNSVKALFPGTKFGSDRRAFMKGICAPLVVQGTSMYAQLRNDIFGL